MSLTKDQMDVVATCIRDAWIAVQSQMGSSNRDGLKGWVVNLVMTAKPYQWVVTEGIQQLANDVFSDVLLTDFVFQLSSQFMLRWGVDKQKYTDLVDVVSWSCSPLASVGLIATATKEFAAMPEVYSSRLASHDDAMGILMSNPWLVCLVLLRSHLAITDPKYLKSDIHLSEARATPDEPSQTSTV